MDGRTLAPGGIVIPQNTPMCDAKIPSKDLDLGLCFHISWCVLWCKNTSDFTLVCLKITLPENERMSPEQGLCPYTSSFQPLVFRTTSISNTCSMISWEYKKNSTQHAPVVHHLTQRMTFDSQPKPTHFPLALVAWRARMVSFPGWKYGICWGWNTTQLYYGIIS